MKTPRDEALDRLSDALDAAAEALFALNYGVEARTTLDSDHDLAWRKHAGQWQLVVVESAAYDDSATTLGQAKVALRLLAAYALPRLHEALRGVADVQLAGIEAATNAAREFLKDLDEGP